MQTPLEEHAGLAKAIGIDRLFLKREDFQLTGSFKERAAERQIEHLVERGKTEAVVSSSGNAAIPLAREARDQGVKLFALVSPELLGEKFETLLSFHPIVIQSRRAMRLANYLSAHHRLPNLRPSVDDHAVVGFVPLGEEIDEQMRAHGGAGTVVSFMTSGASLLGMTKGYCSEPRPVFVAVTNEEVGRMGTARGRREEVSMVAEVAIVSKEEIERAQALLWEHGIEVASEATAAFAWIVRKKPRGNVVWVVSGKAWASKTRDKEPKVNVYHAETFEEVDRIYEED